MNTYPHTFMMASVFRSIYPETGVEDALRFGRRVAAGVADPKNSPARKRLLSAVLAKGHALPR
jgi:hypothetical protein